MEILSQITAANEYFDQVIEIAKRNRNKSIDHLNKAAEVLPNVEKALKELGLNVESFGASKTGINSNWCEEDSLRVSLTAIPTPGNKKFRWIYDAGFDSQGRGKNKKRLQEKATTISEHIFSVAKVKASINPYSLEVGRRQTEETGSVIIEFWVKA